MKFIVAILALCLLAPVVQAAPKHFYTDPKWWAGEAVIAASVWADARTTSMGTHDGLIETNYILGAHPSNSKIIGWSLGMFTGYTVAHAAEWHVSRSLSRPWQDASYFVTPGIVFAFHGGAAIHNARLQSHLH